MEGAYSQLFNARQTVPHEAYDFFIDLLAETIRDEIADCSAQAYDYLSISYAKKMLLFSCDQQLLKFISEININRENKNKKATNSLQYSS